MADKPVFQRAVEGPAVHALVIGVGRYPFLRGGGKAVAPDTEGMGQLTSAPLSARAFADWLLSSFVDPAGRPIASVRVLLAEPSTKAIKLPGGGKANPRPAVVDEVKDAVAGWFGDLDTDPDHLALFFFSGHGVAAGLNQALLLSDFGSNPGDVFDPSIRLNDFWLGMSKAKAREQVYFIDACRSHSETLADAMGAGGRPFVLPSTKVKHERARLAPIFYATLLGEQGYGLRNKPSFFTQALLDGMRGGGGDNSDDEATWLVEATTLGRSVGFLMEQAAKRAKLGQAPINPIDHSCTLHLHRLADAPLVPVTAECAPDNPVAEFFCDQLRWKATDATPFVLYGPREFRAKVGGASGSVTRTVRPPYSKVVIPMAGN